MSIDGASSDGVHETDPCRAAYLRRIERNRHRSVSELIDGLGCEFAVAVDVIAQYADLAPEAVRCARATGHATGPREHRLLVELYALCQTVEDVLGASAATWFAGTDQAHALDRLLREARPAHLVA